ncbi:MAG: GspH/FimT family protein [Deltaproteobacteria bacterium]|nr:GspH/FimT family protein [Deltaproteobacteria bacterium]
MNLETAAEKVSNDLRYARELAGITNTNCGVSFVANGNYTVYQNSLLTPATNPLTRQSFVTDIAALFKKVSLQNTVQVEFDPAGKPVLGSGQTVQLTNGVATASLYITPNTGFILRQ